MVLAGWTRPWTSSRESKPAPGSPRGVSQRKPSSDNPCIVFRIGHRRASAVASSGCVRILCPFAAMAAGQPEPPDAELAEPAWPPVHFWSALSWCRPRPQARPPAWHSQTPPPGNGSARTSFGPRTPPPQGCRCSRPPGSSRSNWILSLERCMRPGHCDMSPFARWQRCGTRWIPSRASWLVDLVYLHEVLRRRGDPLDVDHELLQERRLALYLVELFP